MIWQNVLEIFVTIFAVIDPPGIIPPFLALTHKKSHQRRKQIAARAILISFAILTLFTFIGDFLLDWLKISEGAFYIAGGLLLFIAALNMVLAQPSGIDATTQEENKEAEASQDISIFPLSIPLIAGPGAIATVILFSRSTGQCFTECLTKQFVIIGILVIVLGATYVCLRLSDPIAKILGVTGTNVIGRIFGIILAALSVQFVLNGVQLFLKPLLLSIH